MRLAAAITGAAVIVVILWDAFEALVLPRRVTRRFRPARGFYRAAWWAWTRVALRMRGGRRETYLSFFGPLSLIGLLSAWAVCLVLAFALMQWGTGASFNVPYGGVDLGVAVYLSGTTFFTLGIGDVTPASSLARVLVVIEAGVGFGFLAVVIGYLPVLYQAFSRREVTITLLDARAGSPPSAAELLRRHAADPDALADLMRDWERWSAELLESHISYPVLTFFRSQHDNQSWLAAITTILDAATLVMTGCPRAAARQAELTFAIARHAVVDLAQVLRTPPVAPRPPRLAAGDLDRLRQALAAHGITLACDTATDAAVDELRAMYEPYASALAQRLLMPLPDWGIDAERHDNWRTSAWGRDASAAAMRVLDVHDDD